MNKVNAVVVTYNRLELLKLCIEKLLKQTYKLNKIIIVDNHSDDGTVDFLKNLNSEMVTTVFLESNQGGAGGFYWGIKEACKFDCDYVWIMDDDTITSEDSLEKLLSSAVILKEDNWGFVSSNVLFKDGTPCLMNISAPTRRWNTYAKYNLVSVQFTSFVSMLIPLKIIEEVGLPVKEYFIWGDDGDYSRRILKHHNGYICGDSIVYHYMNENVGVDIINTNPERIGRFFFFYRNTMASKKRDGVKEGFLFWAKSNYTAFKVLFSKSKKKIKKICIIHKGLICGLFMKYTIEKI